MSQPPPSTAWVLWTIPAVYFVFVAAEFAAMTQMALSLTEAGRPAFDVGLLATALWAGILLSSGAATRVIASHGHARVFVAATAGATLALATLALHERYAGWLAGAFVLGLGGGLVWVAGEAWLAEAAPKERRGFFVGLFETAVGLGLMAGPAIVSLMAWAGGPTLVLSVAMMLVALGASLTLLPHRVPSDEGLPDVQGRAVAHRAALVSLALPLVGVSVLSGLMESGVSALLPSVSMRLGFDLETAALLGTVIGAGSALLQPPAGHLADRWGTRRVTLGAWVVVLAANLVLLSVARDPGVVLWAVGFALGGVGGAVYTLMVIELGHRLIGPTLVRAVALLVTSYSVGTALGPMLGGWMF
ncbi:MAG: MFS transporter, partial [Ideonella sp.]|nr:MFS transporter [Ideonella sp.]